MRPWLTLLLYFLLVASAAVSLGVQRGAIGASEQARQTAPWVFLAFAVGFGVYRLALASAHKYSAGKAYFQVGVAALFSMLLFLNAGQQKVPVPHGEDLAPALSDQSPRARALAAELARHRPDGRRYAQDLVRALGDPDPAVAAAAHQSLVSLNQGADLGPPSDPAAAARWTERFR